MGCLCDICLGDIDDNEEDSFEQGQKSIRDFPNGIENDPFAAKDNENEIENTSKSEDYQPGIQGLTDNHNRLLDDDENEDDGTNEEQNIQHGTHQQSHIIGEESSSDSNIAHEQNTNKKYSKINDETEDMNISNSSVIEDISVGNKEVVENEEKDGYESRTETFDEIQEYKYKPVIYIIYHSIWGHVRKLAIAIAEGVENAGGIVKIYQIPETLDSEIIQKMNGVSQSKYATDHPILDYSLINSSDILEKADGFIFGIPARYGMMCSQWKQWWDSTGNHWRRNKLLGKPGSIFTCTSVQSGGQETTAWSTITQFAHHGMLYVPIGYGYSISLAEKGGEDEDENGENIIHGGSAYGAGTFSKSDGSGMPNDYELRVAEYQGEYMTGVVRSLMVGEMIEKGILSDN